MRIHYKISVFLLLAILGIGCFTILMVTTATHVGKAHRQIEMSLQIKDMVRQVSSTISRSQTGFTMYLITDKRSYANDSRKASALMHEQVGLLQQLTAGKDLQQQKIKSLGELITKWDETRNAILDSPFSNNQVNKADAASIGKLLVDSVDRLLAAMHRNEQATVKSMSTKIKEISNGGLLVVVCGGIIYLVFALLLFFQFQRDSRLNKAAEQEMLIREAKYRQMIENAGLPMFTTDRPGNFTFVNNKMEALTGFTTNEITGTHFTFLVAPEFRDIVTAHYREQYEKQTPELWIDFIINTKDRQEKWVEQHSILIKREGKIIGFQCIVRDITERKQAEIQLNKIQNERKQSQYHLQAMLDSMPLVMYIKDLEGKYVLTNKRFHKLIAPGKVAHGKTDYDFNTRENADRNKDAEQRVIETLEPLEQEYTIRKYRFVHHLLLVSFPIFDQNRKLIATGGIAADITEKVNHHEELKKQKLYLEEAEKQLGKLLVTFSREIETNLNGVDWMSNALLETSLSQEQLGLVRNLTKVYDNLLDQAGNLNYILQIKSGQLPVRSVGFKVKEVMETVIAPFRTRMKEKDIELITGIHPDIPDTVMGDPAHLERIIANLLDTAIRSTNRGYIQLGAFPAFGKGFSYLRFVIRDSGTGIHESRLDHIFDPFPPGADSKHPEWNETAVRLYITKQLIDFHKGTIEVTSGEGTGTTFNFSMPFENLS